MLGADVARHFVTVSAIYFETNCPLRRTRGQMADAVGSSVQREGDVMPRGFEKVGSLPTIAVLLVVGVIALGGWLYLTSPHKATLPLATVDGPCNWDSAAHPDDTCATHCDFPYKSWQMQKSLINGKIFVVCCPTGYLPVPGTTTCKKTQ